MADHDDLVRRLRELGEAPTPPELDAMVHSRMAQARLEAGSGVGRRWRPTRLVAAAAAVLLVSLGGLGVAGALPAPAQRLVHDVAEHVGIGLPDADEGPAPSGSDEPSGAGATTTTDAGAGSDAAGDPHDGLDDGPGGDPAAEEGATRGGADPAGRPGATAEPDRTPSAAGATPVQTTAVPTTDQTTVPPGASGASHGDGSANGNGNSGDSGNGSVTHPTHPPQPTVPTHPTTTTRPAKPKQGDATTTATSKPKKPMPDDPTASATTTTKVTGPKG